VFEISRSKCALRLLSTILDDSRFPCHYCFYYLLAFYRLSLLPDSFQNPLALRPNESIILLSGCLASSLPLLAYAVLLDHIQTGLATADTRTSVELELTVWIVPCVFVDRDSDAAWQVVRARLVPLVLAAKKLHADGFRISDGRTSSSLHARIGPSWSSYWILSFPAVVDSCSRNVDGTQQRVVVVVVLLFQGVQFACIRCGLAALQVVLLRQSAIGAS